MKCVRFQRDFGFAHDHIFGIRAVACVIRQAVNLIAFFKPSRGGGIRPNFLNQARHVPTEDERERVRQEIFHVTGANSPINRIHASRMDSDQDFTLSWLWTRRVLVLEDLRPAVVMNSNRFHGLRVCMGRNAHVFGDRFNRSGHNELMAEGCECGRLRRRESQRQFSSAVPENFRATLPFHAEVPLAIPHRLRCLACRSPVTVRLGLKAARLRDHVTLNCFDSSAHMFLSFCEERSAAHRPLGKDYVSCLSITNRHTASQPWN